jgi:hypothetical protein
LLHFGATELNLCYDLRMRSLLIVGAILLGAFIGMHPVSAVIAILYAAKKLHETDMLLACCSGYPTRKLLVYGRVIG